MKAAPLALLLVCAPAAADVAVPRPTAKKTWADSCAARIDAAAIRVGLKPGARVSVIPLRREDGTVNPVEYVEYATPDISVTAGDEPEPRPDQGWRFRDVEDDLVHQIAFRRRHNRFGKVVTAKTFGFFLPALDDCLKMGDTK